MPKYNYVLVRVEEPDEPYEPGILSNAGTLRKVIKEWSDRVNVNTAHNIIRHDRKHFPWPIDRPPSTAPLVPYDETEALFRKIMIK